MLILGSLGIIIAVLVIEYISAPGAPVSILLNLAELETMLNDFVDNVPSSPKGGGIQLMVALMYLESLNLIDRASMENIINVIKNSLKSSRLKKIKYEYNSSGNVNKDIT